jgi:hypothetical protein
MGLFRATKASDTDLVERIRAIDIDRLTPLQALSLLAELQQNLDHSKS